MSKESELQLLDGPSGELAGRQGLLDAGPQVQGRVERSLSCLAFATARHHGIALHNCALPAATEAIDTSPSPLPSCALALDRSGL
eukprot:13362035-Heterocapsa_arctica.AAC.1